MNSRVQIDVQQISDRTVVITLTGDVTNVAEVPIKSAYQEATRHHVDNIILNFADDDHIDSLGLAALIRIIGEAHKQQQSLSITLPSQHSQKIFRLLGIDCYAPIFSSLEEALSHAENNLPN